MKQLGSNILLLILSVLILFGSTGITFTHVECAKGEVWVIGEKPPVCEKVEASNVCPFSGKVCHAPVKPNKKSHDNRKKQTFKIELKVVTQHQKKHLTELNNFEKYPNVIFSVSSFLIFSEFDIVPLQKVHCLQIANAPPEITRPLLSEIQVYLI